MGRPRLRLSLTGYLFCAHVLLLALALLILGALWTTHYRQALDEQYQQRALAIASSVASMPEVADALTEHDPRQRLAPLGERARVATDAQYIVIASPGGTRYSHPNAELIGQQVSTDPYPASQGEIWTGTQEGTEGLTLRAKVPVYAPDTSGESTGVVVGIVSVGILRTEASGTFVAALPAIGATTLVALTLGAGGAWLISRRLRAKTHGLEPGDITALLDDREALLYAVREGVLAVDAQGTVILANPPARALLDLDEDCVGRAMTELNINPALRAVLTGTGSGTDQVVDVGARLVVCNHRPVRVRDTDGGAVITLRDHTELARLTRELDGARTITAGLRAQSHEFANRVHTVAGMLELGAVDEARAFLAELSEAHTRASADICARIGDSALAALVLAKTAQADEAGIALELSPVTHTDTALPTEARADALLILGNLVDNALEAVQREARDDPEAPQWVEILIRTHRATQSDLDRDMLEIRVIDSGPGIAAEMPESIFRSGVSTDGDSSGWRGLGLALVRQTCQRRGGTVTVDDTEETVFDVLLPLPTQQDAVTAGG